MTENLIEDRPRFLAIMLRELHDDYVARGPIALIPVWLISSLGVGGLAAWYIPAWFFLDTHLDVSTSVYAGLLAFNGLLLALSWQAFARIQSSICATGFSSFLKARSLIAGYFFWIDYVQLFQVIAVCSSLAGLITIILDRLLDVSDRAIFGLTIGLSIYALKAALDAIHLMHDVVWLHAEYDQMLAERDNSNVAKFPNGGKG